MNGPNDKEGIPWWAMGLAAGTLMALIAAAAFCSPAQAGELHYTWTAGDGPVPDGYRVYSGDVSPPTVETDVGNALEYTYANLQDCATHYFAVKAYKGAAESQLSTEVSVYPRPEVTLVGNSEQGTRLLTGTNFDSNVKVFVDLGAGFSQLPSGDVERISCTEIRITDVPLLRVQVANVALPLGHGEPMDIFSQPWPGPAVSVD